MLITEILKFKMIQVSTKMVKMAKNKILINKMEIISKNSKEGIIKILLGEMLVIIPELQHLPIYQTLIILYVISVSIKICMIKNWRF